MKKNQLIEQLQKIKGNPEIKMWNGYVDDWMDIKLCEQEFVKESEDFLKESIWNSVYFFSLGSNQGSGSGSVFTTGPIQGSGSVSGFSGPGSNSGLIMG